MEYKPSFAREAYLLALDGKSDEEIARALKISFRTYLEWLIDYPKFAREVEKGAAEADYLAISDRFSRGRGGPITVATAAAVADVVPPLGALPINSQMITSGDSWGSTFVQYTGANDNRSVRWGVLTAMMEYIGHPWRITRLGHKAVSGTTSTQIVAQTTAAIATLTGSPTDGIWLCPERFLNDVATAKTAVQAAADWDTDIAAARAANMRCFIGTCPPQKPGSGTWTAPQVTKVSDYNTLVRAKAGKYVKVLDYDLIGLVAGDYADGIHLNTNGWDKVAAYIVSSGLLGTWLPTFTASSLLGTVYTQNPTMTGGTSSSPANWPAWSAAGGATVAWVPANREVNITGNYSGSNIVIGIQQLTGTGAFPVTGDIVEAVLEVVLPASQTNLLGIDIQPIWYTSGFATLAQGYASLYAPPVAETAVSMARAAGTYRMRVPVVPVAAGTVAYDITGINIRLLDQAGSTAVNLVIGIPYAAQGKAA